VRPGGELLGGRRVDPGRPLREHPAGRVQAGHLAEAVAELHHHAGERAVADLGEQAAGPLATGRDPEFLI